jgi:hypothetical protein
MAASIESATNWKDSYKAVAVGSAVAVAFNYLAGRYGMTAVEGGAGVIATLKVIQWAGTERRLVIQKNRDAVTGIVTSHGGDFTLLDIGKESKVGLNTTLRILKELEEKGEIEVKAKTMWGENIYTKKKK